MAYTINKTWKVNGALADPVAIKLSSGDGNFGVKVAGTGEVVVADGTAMTKTSTGQYTYTFADSPGVTYTIAFEVEYESGVFYREEETVTSPSEGVGAGQTYDTLRRLIGRFLGWGAVADWNADQVQDSADILRSAQNYFYRPDLLPGEKFSHEWSFLTPVDTIALEAEVGAYDLPAGFSMLDGPLAFADSDYYSSPEIEVTSAVRVERRQVPEIYGRPELAAIRPKALDGAVGTQYEIIFGPIPDHAYTIRYRFRVNPSELGVANPFPFGGDAHAETIREACLAAAEQKMNDTAGLHTARFKECLASSISHDRRVAAPKTLGQNIDGSDLHVSLRNGWALDSLLRNPLFVTYEGYEDLI